MADLRYWGIVSLTMNADALFVEAGLTSEKMGFQVAARGLNALGAQGAVFIGRAGLFDESPVTLEVPLPGCGSWTLGAVPVVGWRAAGNAPVLVVTLAYVFALLLGVLSAWLARAHQQVLALASHDRLTGLPNRRLFEERLSQAVLAAHRDRRGGPLLLVDLDGFKAINDSRGHSCGDQVLVHVAQRLAGLARANDTAARLGGDEFGLVLNAVNSSHAALDLAHRMLQDIGAPIRLDNGEYVSVGVSVGIAVFSGDSTEALPTLIERADQALYASKRSGRGKATLAESADRPVKAN